MRNIYQAAAISASAFLACNDCHQFPPLPVTAFPQVGMGATFGVKSQLLERLDSASTLSPSSAHSPRQNGAEIRGPSSGIAGSPINVVVTGGANSIRAGFGGPHDTALISASASGIATIPLPAGFSESFAITIGSDLDRRGIIVEVPALNSPQWPPVVQMPQPDTSETPLHNKSHPPTIAHSPTPQGPPAIRGPSTAEHGSTIEIQVTGNHKTAQLNLGGAAETQIFPVVGGKATITIPPRAGQWVTVSVGSGMNHNAILIEILSPTA